jgi:enoyl-CoA hydratase
MRQCFAAVSAKTDGMSVLVGTKNRVTTVTIDRSASKNAIDAPTARALAEAFRSFDADPLSDVAVLRGEGGTFCAGFDLKAFAGGREAPRLDDDGDGPLGPTRMLLSKPVIAAIDGYAVAGGLELALWCDLRVMERSAIVGVFCRRFGVPLIDGGTIRLARAIGQSRAMDLLLTGRAVGAEEAERIGLVNRVADDGNATQVALTLASELASLPQKCMRSDRMSMYEQWALPFEDALRNEFRRGMAVLESGESLEGAKLFASGAGRHGDSLG